MSGREVKEYTNLSDPKDRKLGKGKDKIDNEDVTFQRMVSKMQDVAGERGGYLHGRGALDSDDLLYLKEQMEAEQDAERLLRRTEKRAFAAFKKAAMLADSTPAPLSLPLRVEPKPKSGIRQQDLLKHVLEIKPKKAKIEQVKKDGENNNTDNEGVVGKNALLPKSEKLEGQNENLQSSSKINEGANNDAISLLGLSYDTSDDDDN